MLISRESLEIILDLIEIKMNALQIHDRDDAREINKLRKCRQELILVLSELNADKKPLTEKAKNLSLSKKSHYKTITLGH